MLADALYCNYFSERGNEYGEAALPNLGHPCSIIRAERHCRPIGHKISPEKFDEMRGQSYEIVPSLLGVPDLEVRPGVGDLLLFNSRKMHAVTPGSDALRLSLSCFVDFRGSASLLSFWS